MVEEQRTPAASALSELRCVAIPGGPATDSPAIVPDDATDPIESAPMEIAAESQEEAPMLRTPLVGATAAAGDSLEMSFVEEDSVAAHAVAESVEVEEPASVEAAMNDVTVETVDPSLTDDEEATVRVRFNPEIGVARIVWESEIARIGERLKCYVVGLLWLVRWRYVAVVFCLLQKKLILLINGGAFWTLFFFGVCGEHMVIHRLVG